MGVSSRSMPQPQLQRLAVTAALQVFAMAILVLACVSSARANDGSTCGELTGAAFPGNDGRCCMYASTEEYCPPSGLCYDGLEYNDQGKYTFNPLYTNKPLAMIPTPGDNGAMKQKQKQYM